LLRAGDLPTAVDAVAAALAAYALSVGSGPGAPRRSAS